jgi:hypothetical protein
MSGRHRSFRVASFPIHPSLILAGSPTAEVPHLPDTVWCMSDRKLVLVFGR